MQDAPERRVFTASLEIRSGSDSSTLELSGYASVFDAPYDMYGGPDAGGWSEVVDPRAFDETLKRSPDLHLLINHEGMPLARTKSGTLSLSTDKVGLRVAASLDRGDPDVQRLERKMSRGDMDEMSFAFRTIRDEWFDSSGEKVGAWEGSQRRLTELNLNKGDVSVVNFGANPATSAELVARALHAADIDATEQQVEKIAALMRSANKSRVSAAVDAAADDVLRAADSARHARDAARAIADALDTGFRLKLNKDVLVAKPKTLSLKEAKRILGEM
jgi:HK97 family phage prohead protease